MKRLLHSILGLGLMVAVAACGSETRLHGNSLDASALDQLQIGSTRRIEVEALFGKPSASGAFDSGRIYYIAQSMIAKPGRKIEMQTRTIVAFAFDETDRLQSIQFTDESDGREVFYVDSATPTPGDTYGLFDQIFNNLTSAPSANQP